MHKLSVMAQLGFLYSVCPPDNQAPEEVKTRSFECITSWMEVLAMFRSQCSVAVQDRFDCLLVLNQRLLSDIIGANETGLLNDIKRVGESGRPCIRFRHEWHLACVVIVWKLILWPPQYMRSARGMSKSWLAGSTRNV